ncbi:PAS domain S-box protein [Desulfovibrio inopinatus]|uniref:PAS domain S-box protein n=1 Tax=Desulfovibrio inopinatus TaxID=102109 RepID=UPI0003F7C3BD|nr:PAS domain S-box protein [Desulfovibrio inopinatus]
MALEQILIVEDDPTTAFVLEQFIQKLGYRVSALLSTGEEAIARISELHPDLVLMDINLAGAIDGVVAASTIHQLLDIPVIYITAAMGDELLSRVKSSGARGFIQKPVRLLDVQIHIELALHNARLEKRLRASEEKHRAMFDQAVIGMFTLNADGRISNLNKAFAHMLGYATQQEARQYAHRLDALFFDDEDAIRFQKGLSHGGLQDFETRVLGKDGNLVWVSLHIQSVNDIGDADIQFEGSMLDITARREAEETSARYMELLKRTINSMPSQICVLDLDKNVILINEAMAQTAGVSAHEAFGKKCDEISPQNFCLRKNCPLEELIRDGCSHEREITDHQTGTRRLITASPFYDQNDELIGCVHVVRELSSSFADQEQYDNCIPKMSCIS